MDWRADEASPGAVYHLMIQTIVPRPVAWVLSDSGEGRLNLAPFSYFNGVCSDPPLLMLSIGHKPDGSRKDTWRNIDERSDFVVHLARADQAEAVTACAAVLPHGESELEAAGLRTEEFAGSRLPRIEGAPVAFACRKHRILELGAGPQGVIFGEITAAWIDDALVHEDNGRLRIDARRLDPLARLGGDDYGRLGEVFTVRRPR